MSNLKRGKKRNCDAGGCRSGPDSSRRSNFQVPRVAGLIPVRIGAGGQAFYELLKYGAEPALGGVGECLHLDAISLRLAATGPRSRWKARSRSTSTDHPSVLRFPAQSKFESERDLRAICYAARARSRHAGMLRVDSGRRHCDRGRRINARVFVISRRPAGRECEDELILPSLHA